MTEINLTARQVFGTNLITNDAEMVELCEIILKPSREHLEATGLLGPRMLPEGSLGSTYCPMVICFVVIACAALSSR